MTSQNSLSIVSFSQNNTQNSSVSFDFSRFYLIDNKNNFCSLISSEEILVFEMVNGLNFNLMYSYKRSNDDITENGPNQWLKFITEKSIAFGTSNGAIFLVDIQLKLTKEIKTGFTVTDVFVNYKENKICICVLGPKIIILSANGDSIESVTFTETPSSIIKNIVFAKDSYYFNTFATLYRIKLNEIYTKEPQAIAEEVMLLRSKENNEEIAISDFAGNIYLINDDKEGDIKTKVGNSSEGILFLEITKNGVLFIDGNGTIQRNDKKLTKKEITNAICISYDEKNDRLLYILGKQLISISLDSLLQIYENQNNEEIPIQKENLLNQDIQQNEQQNTETIHKIDTKPLKTEIENKRNQSEELNSNENENKQENEIKEQQIKEKANNNTQNTIITQKQDNSQQFNDIIPKVKKQNEVKTIPVDQSSFSTLDDDKKCEVLLRASLDDINLLIDKEKDSLISIKGKENLIDSLIKTDQWMRASILSDALDCSLNECIQESFDELDKYSLGECIKSIYSDLKLWSGVEMHLKMLAFSFNMTGLTRWSLASFLALNDKGKARVLITDQNSLYDECVQYTRDEPDSQASTILKELNLGF